MRVLGSSEVAIVVGIVLPAADWASESSFVVQLLLRLLALGQAGEQHGMGRDSNMDGRSIKFLLSAFKVTYIGWC